MLGEALKSGLDEAEYLKDLTGNQHRIAVTKMVHRRVRGGKYKINYAGPPAPVEVGDELEVNITGTHPSGGGVTSIRDYTIVVPKAKPRDSVKIRVTGVNGKTATGEIIP